MATSVFTSIFPPSHHSHTVPTPKATPDVPVTGFGQSFGGPSATLLESPLLTSPRVKRQPRQSIRNARHQQAQSSSVASRAQREVQRNLAWSTATQFLSLRGASTSQALPHHANERRSREVDEALQLLLTDGEEQGEGQAGLMEWYLDECREHFQSVVKTRLPTSSGNDLLDWMERTIQTLSSAKEVYLSALDHHVAAIVRKVNPGAAQELHRTSETAIATVVVDGLDRARCQETLTMLFLEAGRRELPLSWKMERLDSATLRLRTDAIIVALHGLCHSSLDLERALAAAVDQLLDELLRSDYLKVDWYGRHTVAEKLTSTIQHSLAAFIDSVTQRILPDGYSQTRIPSIRITQEKQQQWTNMLLADLGRARLHYMFDYVVRFPESLGAVLDIKAFLPLPGARAEVVQSFQRQLHQRLLHAGATSVQILDTYVHTIRAFTELDPKGVLLDRVARPIRRYLKDRDDTTSIIIASLLQEVDDDTAQINTGEDISVQIAKQMRDAIDESSREHDDADLDWNNMDWTPDPHDAGPEYRRSKTEDIISSLLSLYDREDFITELKNILGAHLLRTQNDELEKEIRLLEMFKARLGEDKLQAVEVMLHDIEESRHINASVKADGEYRRSMPVNLSAQILSSFFWPSLRDEAFNIPSPVAKQQKGYDASFRALKDMRKLQWLQELGTATVTLELSDRIIEEECSTAQASVVYAFSDDGSQRGRAVQKSVEELIDTLSMEEATVRQSLAFWVGRLVLAETAPLSDNYKVLETLPTSTAAAKQAEVAAALAVETAQAAAVKSPEEVLMENMQMYRQFVLGMLTNQGKMEAGRMHMMLKMVVPGGFAFNLEDLRVFLQRMGVEGLVSAEGDAWSIIK